MSCVLLTVEKSIPMRNAVKAALERGGYAVRKSEGRRAGVTGWIAAPFDPEQLLATLARVV